MEKKVAKANDTSRPDLDNVEVSYANEDCYSYTQTLGFNTCWNYEEFFEYKINFSSQYVPKILIMIMRSI